MELQPSHLHSRNGTEGRVQSYSLVRKTPWSCWATLPLISHWSELVRWPSSLQGRMKCHPYFGQPCPAKNSVSVKEVKKRMWETSACLLFFISTVAFFTLWWKWMVVFCFLRRTSGLILEVMSYLRSPVSVWHCIVPSQPVSDVHVEITLDSEYIKMVQGI